MKNDNALLDVYYNRTRDLWSVRRRRLVIEHTPDVVLVDCILHAGESARQRCLRTGQRDVHSWIRGRLADGPRPPEAVRIGYRRPSAGSAAATPMRSSPLPRPSGSKRWQRLGARPHRLPENRA